MSESVLNDAPLHLMTANALRPNLEFADLIREGYPHDSFYMWDCTSEVVPKALMEDKRESQRPRQKRGGR
jgi:hypothetical protein